MKIVGLDTHVANAGLRNYVFVCLRTDKGLVGVGEATLEWQELAVESILREWVTERILGTDPVDIERTIGDLLRDQYQGGPTVLSAISGVEIALWDLVGKACGEPVYRLLGGRCHDRLEAYANGWYGGCASPAEFAAAAEQVVGLGYRALKFDPFGTAWKELSFVQMDQAEAIVAAVRGVVGPQREIMIEVHGRLSPTSAIQMGRRLAAYRPAWYEEPVAPDQIELCALVRRNLPFPIAAGERLYTLADFRRLFERGAVDIVQPDLAHAGGLLVGKKIAALAQAAELRIAPHCSIGPVALAAALHFDWSTPAALIQENFGDFDVPWRSALVKGWDPCHEGEYRLPTGPGLGLELDLGVVAAHPYQRGTFPSLWDRRWIVQFTQNQ